MKLYFTRDFYLKTCVLEIPNLPKDSFSLEHEPLLMRSFCVWYAIRISWRKNAIFCFWSPALYNFFLNISTLVHFCRVEVGECLRCFTLHLLKMGNHLWALRVSLWKLLIVREFHANNHSHIPGQLSVLGLLQPAHSVPSISPLALCVISILHVTVSLIQCEEPLHPVPSNCRRNTKP